MPANACSYCQGTGWVGDGTTYAPRERCHRWPQCRAKDSLNDCPGSTVYQRMMADALLTEEASCELMSIVDAFLAVERIAVEKGTRRQVLYAAMVEAWRDGFNANSKGEK